MNISAECTATDSFLGMPPQLHVHTNICSANHISEFSVCRCVDMAKMTYLSSNRMRAFPHHPCLQRLLWKRSNILWAAVFWTKMTCWHQSSEENAQTAAEEHLWMDRTLKLEADGLQQHWVPLLYEKLRLQSSQDQWNQTAEDCKTGSDESRFRLWCSKGRLGNNIKGWIHPVLHQAAGDIESTQYLHIVADHVYHFRTRVHSCAASSRIT